MIILHFQSQDNQLNILSVRDQTIQHLSGEYIAPSFFYTKIQTFNKQKWSLLCQIRFLMYLFRIFLYSYLQKHTKSNVSMLTSMLANAGC